MTVNPLRRTLDPSQLRLVQVLYDTLIETGAWPVGGYVRDVLGAEGLDLDAIVPRLSTGWHYLPITWGRAGGAIQQSDPVAATVAGLHQLTSARWLVDDVLALVSGLARRYHDLPLDPQTERDLQVTRADLVGLLEQHHRSDPSLVRPDPVLAVFANEPPGWHSNILLSNADQTWEAQWTVGRFLNLTDVDDYLDRVQTVFGPDVTTSPEPPVTGQPKPAATPRPGESGVTPGDAKRITAGYIGVKEGYLGDFNRSELQTFYIHHNLPYDIDDHSGTTKDRFISILLAAPAQDQAVILRGVLDRFPLTDAAPPGRTREARSQIEQLIARIDGHAVDLSPPPDVSAAVSQALADAEMLLGSSGAGSALDRIHTALHGYLRDACERADITTGNDPSIGVLWGLLRRNHPKLAPVGPRSDDIDRIQKTLGTITDALLPLRNRASMAHPNAELLADPEAMLAINAAKSVFAYVDAKLRLP